MFFNQKLHLKMKIELSKPNKKFWTLTQIVGMGAFVSGIYQGFCESKGIPIDPSFKDFIRYGPIIANGLLEVPIGIELANNPRHLEQLLKIIPEEDKKEVRKYLPFILSKNYPIICMLSTVGLEYIGYMGGKYVGSIT
ncbi:MAG: hypothetical protein PHF86_09120 [Candidatus Nanoarchaeia archaeon]|nr:hypothetical protein [Candidatus Nanoarchaeia archaeon]